MIEVDYPRKSGGYTLSADQVNELRQILNDQIAKYNINKAEFSLGVPIYEKIQRFISNWGQVGVLPSGVPGLPGQPIFGWIAKPGVHPDVWRWIDGAIKVNSGEGFYADFIRDYTKAQFELRGGTGDADKLNQIASNNIAFNLADDIIRNLGVLPGILGLGAIDAGAAASEVFANLPAGQADYAPWAGTLLFPYLASSVFFENLILNSEKVLGKIGLDTLRPETKIIKYNEGTYDLVALLQASRMASDSSSDANRFDAIINLAVSSNKCNFFTRRVNQLAAP